MMELELAYNIMFLFSRFLLIFQKIDQPANVHTVQILATEQSSEDGYITMICEKEDHGASTSSQNIESLRFSPDMLQLIFSTSDPDAIAEKLPVALTLEEKNGVVVGVQDKDKNKVVEEDM